MSERCGYIGPGDTCTYNKGHDGTHSWEGGAGRAVQNGLDPERLARAIRDASQLHGYKVSFPIGGSWTQLAEAILAAPPLHDPVGEPHE